MEKLNQALMSACRLDQFPLVSRLHMLELLELRSMDWQSNVVLDNYYRQKLAQIEVESKPRQSQTAPVLTSVVNPFQASFQGDRKDTTKQAELQSVRAEKDNKYVASTPSPPPEAKTAGHRRNASDTTQPPQRYKSWDVSDTDNV